MRHLLVRAIPPSRSPDEVSLTTVPRVGQYTPPPCAFNKVTMNLSVSSSGRQFDRLGIMYLGDVEVFRTYLITILFSLIK